MSPHFGLINDQDLTFEEALLMRARLHWRCGKRRLSENKTAAGIATIYDALLSGMRWYIMVEKVVKSDHHSTEDLENERYVFHILKKNGVIDSSINIGEIQDLVDKALMDEDITSGKGKFVNDIEKFLTSINVLPFDESKLPPEDPSTF